MEYVAGLLYSDEGDRVTLIQKNRPEWQAGLYNAVGGKIEFGETAYDAMKREFIEEAGVDIDWDHRITLEGPDYKVHFFSCHNTEAMTYLRTMTDEVVEVVETYDLPENLIPNLWWIIPMMNDDTIEVQTITVSG
jgi:8-oxo-dGTP pyrophosphatase MutT (NUDIX family)